MSRVSELGYLEVDEEALSRFEKEAKLDVGQEQLIESQYIYFNSTNKGEILVYNRLSNCLLRVGSGGAEMFEYRLPKLYQLEFSDKPEHLIMHIGGEEEGDDGAATVFLAYVQEDDLSGQKLLVLRKVSVERDSEQISGTEGHNVQFRWTEMDYIETKVQMEHSQTVLRGIVWWEEGVEVSRDGDGSGLTGQQPPSLGYPSILMVTSSRLTLFSLREHGVQPVWQISEANMQMWYNMEFQCLLLQTGPNQLTPLINLGMGGPQQRPVKLQPLELILSSEIKQGDIFLLSIYQSLYCVHVDYSIKRVSLRDLFSQDSPDLVLDIKDSFQEFTLVVIDNVIVVVSLHGRKAVGLFDIKLVRDGAGRGSSRRSNVAKTGTDSHYYMIPALFSDELSDNAIVCLYDRSKSDMYLKSLKRIKSQNLSNYSILLMSSSSCIVIRLDLNKIQYSRLGLCCGPLIDCVISSSKDCPGRRTASLEKMDILPFVSNRSQASWDKTLLERLKLLAEAEKDLGSNQEGAGRRDKAFPKSITLLMEIIKIKAELKLKVRHEYYDVLLELIFFLGRESLLQYALQYHIIEDSNKVLRELYHMYLFNRGDQDQDQDQDRDQGHVRFSIEQQDRRRCCFSDNDEAGNRRPKRYFKISNVSWLEQICLDMAYRLNNLKILIDVLIYKKEYKRAIQLLRRGSEQSVVTSFSSSCGDASVKAIVLACSRHCQACKYPIYNILYELGNDVRLQERDPNLLRDVVKEIQKWISEYFSQVERIRAVISACTRDNPPHSSPGEVEKYSFSVVGRPNISKCHIWLPELINLKDLNGDDELMSHCSQLGGGDFDLGFRDGCRGQTGNASSSLDSGKNTSYSTLESIYLSAAESSNETFIISRKATRERPTAKHLTYNDSSGGGGGGGGCGDDKTGSSHGKSPLLHYEPGLLASSSLYTNNCSPYSSSSSYSSDSSSSFNSYE